MKSFHIVAAVACIACFSQPQTGAAQPQLPSQSELPPPPPTGVADSSRDEDGAKYLADTYDITLEDAKERLAIIELAGELRADLLSMAGDEFAEVSVSHSPVFKVTISSTNGDAVLAGRRAVDPKLRRYIKFRKAKVGRKSRLAELNKVMRMLEAKGVANNAYYDGDKDTLTVMVEDRAKAEMALAQLLNNNRPADLTIIEQQLAQPTQSAPSAGFPAKSYDYIAPTHVFYNIHTDNTVSVSCTWAFKARYAGQVGILTAGHCENHDGNHTSAQALGTGYFQYSAGQNGEPNHWVEFYAPTLEFRTRSQNGVADKYDFQFHPMPNLTVYSSFYTAPGGSLIYVNGEVAAPTVTKGKPVCRYGNKLGWSCGEITNANYYQNSEQTSGWWLYRAGNSAQSCVGGDSGGPVVTSPVNGYAKAAAMINFYARITEADSLGFHDDCVFMPIDYINDVYDVRLVY